MHSRLGPRATGCASSVHVDVSHPVHGGLDGLGSLAAAGVAHDVAAHAGAGHDASAASESAAADVSAFSPVAEAFEKQKKKKFAKESC